MASWEGRIPSGEVIKNLPQGFMRLLVAWDTLVRRDPGDGDFDTVSLSTNTQGATNPCVSHIKGKKGRKGVHPSGTWCSSVRASVAVSKGNEHFQFNPNGFEYSLAPLRLPKVPKVA